MLTSAIRNGDWPVVLSTSVVLLSLVAVSTYSAISIPPVSVI